MVLSQTASANGATPPYRILVLNSYHIGMQWEDRITQGILSELAQSELNLEIFIEHMDTKRYATEKIFPHLASLYATKYKRPPDLLIVVDDNALNFVVEHRDTLFPNVPVVFAGINNYEKAHRLHPMGFTGLLETTEIKQTLELILKLHPNTQRIISLADSVPTAAFHLKNYYAAAAEISSTVEFSDLRNWTFDELKESLAALPEHTVLLFFSVDRDRNGNFPPSTSGARFIVEHTTLPMYTLWVTHGIGDGAVGGFVPHGPLHGRLAAQLAVRILKGEAASDIPIIDKVGNRPMFDYEALQTHQIPISALPEKSIIVNEPQSFYYRYYKYIWATFSFIMLQSAMIAVLLCLINKSRRRERSTMQRANAELEQRVEERTQELQLRTQELERFNEELNQFTYIASHDLQEPVRNLISYSTLLTEDLGEAPPGDVAEDLYYITSAAARMQQLVQDLLVLSRAGRAAVKTERVALDECVDRALDALRVRIEETGATVSRVPLPVVIGDPTLLTQLYQNLLGNALKFVGEDQPMIQLTVDSRDNMWILGVRDNGIGIEPEYAVQIFKPFKRLHGMAEYEGTGIGLSICQKAVERHNGTIWVESEPGKGAHFQFTLPVAPDLLVAEQ
jgi:signal transduction histidine kinase